MSAYCEKCHARKVLVEENSLACPICDTPAAEMPRFCDYCLSHVAFTPSDHGTWICDSCIKAALISQASNNPATRVQKDPPEVNANAS